MLVKGNGATILYILVEIVAEPEVGEIYEGVVSGIKDFGLFVKIMKNFESLVHISEITGEILAKIEDAKLKEGDKVFVRYLGVDKRGKTRLSMVGIDQKTGKEIKIASKTVPAFSAGKKFKELVK